MCADVRSDVAVLKVEAAGLHIVGGGTITFDTDTGDGVRKYFDYAKAF